VLSTRSIQIKQYDNRCFSACNHIKCISEFSSSNVNITFLYLLLPLLIFHICKLNVLILHSSVVISPLGWRYIAETCMADLWLCINSVQLLVYGGCTCKSSWITIEVFFFSFFLFFRVHVSKQHKTSRYGSVWHTWNQIVLQGLCGTSRSDVYTCYCSVLSCHYKSCKYCQGYVCTVCIKSEEL